MTRLARTAKAFSGSSTCISKNGLTISSRFYPGARHELVNETNKGEVTTDLREWLLQFA